MDGVLIIDKPKGPTSHDICREVKRAFGVKKVGHAGTLDPLATGVLIILIGKATKLSNQLMATQKEYLFTMKLGEVSDTFDAQGKLSSYGKIPLNVENAIKDLTHCFLGKSKQEAPAYSAIKHKGVPLYKLARQGKQVPKKIRQIEIFEFTLEEINLPFVTLRVTCSCGTYVRSLAHDIGKKLGCGAHITDLRRLRSGDYSLNGAVSLPLTPDSALHLKTSMIAATP